MAIGCYGRSKKRLKLRTGSKELRVEELGEKMLRRRKPPKGCSAK